MEKRSMWLYYIIVHLPITTDNNRGIPDQMCCALPSLRMNLCIYSVTYQSKRRLQNENLRKTQHVWSKYPLMKNNWKNGLVRLNWKLKGIHENRSLFLMNSCTTRKIWMFASSPYRGQPLSKTSILILYARLLIVSALVLLYSLQLKK